MSDPAAPAASEPDDAPATTTTPPKGRSAKKVTKTPATRAPAQSGTRKNAALAAPNDQKKSKRTHDTKSAPTATPENDEDLTNNTSTHSQSATRTGAASLTTLRRLRTAASLRTTVNASRQEAEELRSAIAELRDSMQTTPPARASSQQSRSPKDAIVGNTSSAVGSTNSSTASRTSPAAANPKIWTVIALIMLGIPLAVWAQLSRTDTPTASANPIHLDITLISPHTAAVTQNVRWDAGHTGPLTLTTAASPNEISLAPPRHLNAVTDTKTITTTQQNPLKWQFTPLPDTTTSKLTYQLQGDDKGLAFTPVVVDGQENTSAITLTITGGNISSVTCPSTTNLIETLCGSKDTSSWTATLPDSATSAVFLITTQS